MAALERIVHYDFIGADMLLACEVIFAEVLADRGEHVGRFAYSPIRQGGSVRLLGASFRRRGRLLWATPAFNGSGAI